MRLSTHASARRDMDSANLRRTFWSTLVVLVAGILVISSLTAAPALAKGPSPRPTGSETCWVDPTPVTDGQQYTVWGSGFAPSQNYTIFVGNGTILMTASDALGLFSSWDWAKFRDPATVTVKIYFQSDSRHRNLLATCSLLANGS